MHGAGRRRAATAGSAVRHHAGRARGAVGSPRGMVARPPAANRPRGSHYGGRVMNERLFDLLVIFILLVAIFLAWPAKAHTYCPCGAYLAWTADGYNVQRRCY